MKALKDWLKSVFWALVVILSIRFFFVDFYVVNSHSMESTLKEGDVVLISPFSYGSRLPITLLTFPFAFRTLPYLKNIQGYLDWIELPYFRLPGTSGIQRNDVVLFNFPNDHEYPIDHRMHFIKRCVGLPGDTIVLINNDVFIGNLPVAFPDSAKKDHLISSLVPVFNDAQMAQYSAGRHECESDWNYCYLVSMNAQQLSEIKKIIPEEATCKVMNQEKGFHIYPANTDQWSSGDLGPLTVPYCGMEVNLNDPFNHHLKKLAQLHEGLDDNDSSSVNYKFTENYYYVMGDNRHRSSDSRDWGFVPESHIISKVSSIAFRPKTAKTKSEFFISID